jgi:hypothetical protein
MYRHTLTNTYIYICICQVLQDTKLAMSCLSRYQNVLWNQITMIESITIYIKLVENGVLDVYNNIYRGK